MNEQEREKWLEQNSKKLKLIAYVIASFAKDLYKLKELYTSDELLYANRLLKENKDDIVATASMEKEKDDYIKFVQNNLFELHKLKYVEECYEKQEKEQVLENI